MRGIDISEHNGKLNFEILKNQVDFIMIRATWGRYQKDKMYKEYTEKCIEYNIPFGYYYYSYALNEKEAKEEVSFFLRTISEYKNKITFPLAIDMEDTDSYKRDRGFPDNQTLCNICQIACDEIGLAGYYPIIYASLNYFEHILNCENIEKYNKWLAWWSDKAKEKVDKTKYQMLQYTSKGTIQGLTGMFDMNEAYVEFDKLIAYIKNVMRIQEIKLRSGLEDISIQYMSLYKFGNFLLEKIFNRLREERKIKDSSQDIHKVVQLEYGLEDKTIQYLESYIYSEPLFLKLYKAICLQQKEDDVK